MKWCGENTGSKLTSSGWPLYLTRATERERPRSGGYAVCMRQRPAKRRQLSCASLGLPNGGYPSASGHFCAVIRELQRLLGKKAMENEILREAVEVAKSRKWIARSPSLPGDEQ